MEDVRPWEGKEKGRKEMSEVFLTFRAVFPVLAFLLGVLPSNNIIGFALCSLIGLMVSLASNVKCSMRRRTRQYRHAPRTRSETVAGPAAAAAVAQTHLQIR